MTTKPIGLYVHIPFCVRKCNYCDFCSFPIGKCPDIDGYIDALCTEIESYGDMGIGLDSIFFGGGTPSLLNDNQLERINMSIRKSFTVSSELEFTAEVNPGTVDINVIDSFRRIGVNRLSIGLQSIHENELKILGRIHNYKEFLDTYKLALGSGITNINVDLMYGIPEQTAESFLETLNAVISLRPQHVSLYGLILEEGTPFYEQKELLPIPCEDVECDMYYLASDFMRRSGYDHYEISNYALSGYCCRHNIKYWKSEEYLGVGLSAYSYLNGKRFGNTRDMAEYLSGNRRQYVERIDQDARAYEYVMLRLRLAEGFSLNEYEREFGHSFLSGKEKTIYGLIDKGLIRLEENILSLTDEGFYVSNYILTELI